MIMTTTLTRADSSDLLRALEWLGGDTQAQRQPAKIDFAESLRVAKLIRILRVIDKETQFANRTQIAVYSDGAAGIAQGSPKYMEAQEKLIELMGQEVAVDLGTPFTHANLKLTENNFPVHILAALLPVIGD